MSRFFHIFLIISDVLCLPVVWSESHIFQFMHRQKTHFFTFLKRSFFNQVPEFSTISESMHPILRYVCFGIFTIYALIYGHLLLKWIRPNTGDAMCVIQYQLRVTQLKSAKCDEKSVPSKGEKWSLLSMHDLEKVRVLVKVPVNRKTKKSSKTLILILHCWEAFMNLIAGSLSKFTNLLALGATHSRAVV